ncbi:MULTISPECIES: dTDP-4-dehydrorhamnose reductase [Pantoea]|uniref:dTDP-4-dehydrorhamnose reductase n=1 Tax=Pantoea TaxID=53335 RepID=UPI0007630BED|nr:MULTISPECIES: dTDP-4-dehydrorhamnose reductase [Pantoea]AMB76384.1 dTDP-4-dehydrorhamnose reductase [Pantoea ananatis]MCS3402390.1 dTDP-4-dehydrorhamnose reductase [Pantoea sp. B566]PWW14770.1 dTDP-4-dehydrorhamnose reductase [Pantoea sp. AG702]SKA67306.1 dTDP-4-dehydrorhamnose reductase [Pantoea ananatis]
MNILLFGKSGQLGWELQRSLAPLGNVIALDRHAEDYCGDLSKLDKIAETIRQIKPAIIVNAAAYTAVDKAESQKEEAYLLNAQSIEVIAREAQKLKAWVVHYSTDYVFSGLGEKPWSESDIAEPVNTYGKSKLLGEKNLISECTRHLIFRTSWVYAAKGSNFAKKMLEMAKEKSVLSVIDDQFGAPTGAELLADCTAHALRVALEKPQVAGIYHLSASGTTNWYLYATYVFDEARRLGIPLKVEKVNAVPTSAYPTPAKRPQNSRLENTLFQTVFKLTLPEWHVGVRRMLTEILTSER